MLALQDISLSFGGRTLLDHIDWQIREKDRVALIGGNGVGKSTLMKVIAGMMSPDTGKVAAPRHATFGYLPQDGLYFEGRSLFAEVRSAFDVVLALEGQLKDLERQLEEVPPEDDSYPGLIEQYDRLSERFQQLDGYRIEAEIGKVLEGLGFTRQDWDRNCETFSGGWQMRIALARLLLQRPTLLLMDEPTNHLDLEARDWLRMYLADHDSAVMLVSHDRFFLDAVAKRCTELFAGKLSDYFGNFTYYEKERVRRFEALQEQARRQDEEIAKLERFIERFRYKATKATQVQSRVKQLEKIERIELPTMAKKVKFSFAEPPRSGRQVLDLQRIRKAYGSLLVLDGVDVTVERGERLALVGVNGAGKSTLMRIMANQEEFEGERVLGYNVALGFFAQDQAQVLNPVHTVYQSLEEVAPYEMIPRLRTLLGSFLFQGDDIDKKVSVLSGGERSRLALARLLMHPYNLLLLDEPTNHLDIQAQEMLLNALKDFPGTVVFVSHDRFFVDQLATRVVEVDNRKTESFLGNYAEYRRVKMARGDDQAGADGVLWSTHATGDDVQEESRAPKRKLTPGKAPVSAEGASRQQQYAEIQQARRSYEKRHRKLTALVAELEQKVEACEAEIAEIEEAMAEAGFFDDHEAANKTTERYNTLKTELDSLYTDWEQAGQDLSALEEEAPS